MSPKMNTLRFHRSGACLVTIMLLSLSSIPASVAQQRTFSLPSPTYGIDIQISPETLRLVCGREVWNNPNAKATLDLIEVAEEVIPRGSPDIPPGTNLTDKMIEVGQRISLEDFKQTMADAGGSPELLDRLNRRFGNRMEINHQFYNQPDFVVPEGYKELPPRVTPEGKVTVRRYYRHNANDLPTSGTLYAGIELKHRPVEVPQGSSDYHAGFLPSADIHYEWKDKPANPTPQAQEQARKFRSDMKSKRSRIIEWLNQPRDFMTRAEARGIRQLEEDSAPLVFDAEEINFAFCSKKYTINPRFEIRYLGMRSSPARTNRSDSFGDD